MPTRDELQILQALSLDLKISMTKRRLRDWIGHYGENGVYLSWSGGKDSTVLRHIIMQDWPNVESVFVNTGLEYPEIQAFVRAAKDRGEPVTILRPEMRFDEVIKKYGYPIISKRVADTLYYARKNIAEGKDTQRVRQLAGSEMLRNGNPSMFNAKKYAPLVNVDFCISSMCCDVMKKKPLKVFQQKTDKVAITATTADESVFRKNRWLKHGCNAFDTKNPMSTPMAFWTEQDVLEYIKRYNVEIPSVYGDVVYERDPEQIRLVDMENYTVDCTEICEMLCTTGCDRTGCIFCAFGAHIRGDERFLSLKETHPRQYEYCIGGGEYNEDGIWQPNKQGLGMGHVFDELNRLYGDGFIKY